jgi:NAD(P)-dependent dehydrogenase (short-subunit alcohol dehydrogenase family)
MGLFSAVVTGGASGIGTAVARKLASRGIAVLIADVQVEKGQSLVKEIRTKYKTPAEFVRTDVSQESDVQKMVQTAVDSWGRLDYAANCAGICEKIFDEEETVTAELVDRSVLIPGEVQILLLCQAVVLLSRDDVYASSHCSSSTPPSLSCIITASSNRLLICYSSCL